MKWGGRECGEKMGRTSCVNEGELRKRKKIGCNTGQKMTCISPIFILRNTRTGLNIRFNAGYTNGLKND